MIVIVRDGNLGAFGSLALTALFVLVPSIIETLMHRDTHESPQSIPTTRSGLSTQPAYFAVLFLQVLIPTAFVGMIAVILTTDRFRRFLGLETLENQNHETQARPRPTRSSAAIAAQIRKLPLIEYQTRADLEKLSLKDLVAYRNEARAKGYKAITTSSGKRKSEILQSRAEVIREIVGRAGGGEDGEDGEDECSICFAQYESNDILRILPKCGHVFHAECGDLWFVRNPRCPLCKSSI